MKKLLLTIIFLGFTIISTSQNASVEKSIYNVQAGFLGVWVNSEARLSNQFALRSEIGFDAGFFGGDFYPKNGYVFAPVITLEPRWYSNLNRRVKKNRSIVKNSGNFVALKTSYHPNWFTISNYENVTIVSDISIIPTYGIRRMIGSHFNYEAGLGVGYVYFFAKNAGYTENQSDAAINLYLRIGYTF